jgi:hypothetical protein
MPDIEGSYLVLGDGSRPSNHYRLVDGQVQFSKDGNNWRTLSDEDLKLHLTLETPLAPWLKSHWGEAAPKPKRTAKTRKKTTSG